MSPPPSRTLPVCWLRLPARDLLAAFAAAPDEERFFLEGSGGEGPGSLLALGCVRALEAEGRGALAELGRQLAALRGVLRPHGAAAAWGGAVLTGGAAFDGGRPAGPAWQGFPAGRLVLPRVLARLEPDGLLRVAVAGESDPEAARAVAEAALSGRGAGSAVAAGGRSRAGGAPVPEPWPRGASADTRPGFAEAASEAGWTPGEPPAWEPAAEAHDLRLVSEPAPACYRSRVARALEAIAGGGLEKVVVARSCRLEAAAPFDVARALVRLRAAQGASRLFAVARGERTFLGATPERLAEVQGDRVRVEALAGSVARAAGGEGDAARGQRLRESKKDQEEHAVVVRAVRRALRGICRELRAPEAPQVLAADGVLHLHTPFEARLAAPGAGLLELAARLHPTPAVAGAPVEAACAWLRAHEGLDRGWYAGAVGFAGLDGSGELAVALRCALVAGATARLYAGAGVVAGSDPEAELEETRVKLRPALGALLEL